MERKKHLSQHLLWRVIADTGSSQNYFHGSLLPSLPLKTEQKQNTCLLLPGYGPKKRSGVYSTSVSLLEPQFVHGLPHSWEKSFPKC